MQLKCHVHCISYTSIIHISAPPCKNQIRSGASAAESPKAAWHRVKEGGRRGCGTLPAGKPTPGRALVTPSTRLANHTEKEFGMAAKHSKYSKWGFAAITGGLALTVVEAMGSVSYLVGQAQPSYLVIGGGIITVISAILPMLAERPGTERRIWRSSVSSPCSRAPQRSSPPRSSGPACTGSGNGGAGHTHSGSNGSNRRARCQGHGRRRGGRPGPSAAELRRVRIPVVQPARARRHGQRPAGNGWRLPGTSRQMSASFQLIRRPVVSRRSCH